MNRERLRFFLTLLALIAALIVVYFNLKTGKPSLGERILWIMLFLDLVVAFFLSTWDFVWSETNDQINNQRRNVPPPPPVPNPNTDIHIARYNHINAEITRYRDLVWKIVAFAWAIYYALLRFFEKGVVGIKIDRATTLYASLPEEWFYFFLFLAAVFATIFHLFCEIMVARNQERRRFLEVALGLINPIWAHQESDEHPARIGFVFSIFVFASLTWTPPLAMLLFRV